MGSWAIGTIVVPIGNVIFFYANLTHGLGMCRSLPSSVVASRYKDALMQMKVMAQKSRNFSKEH